MKKNSEQRYHRLILHVGIDDSLVVVTPEVLDRVCKAAEAAAAESLLDHARPLSRDNLLRSVDTAHHWLDEILGEDKDRSAENLRLRCERVAKAWTASGQKLNLQRNSPPVPTT